MLRHRYETNTHSGLQVQPSSDLSWGIVSTRDATSRFHFDTAGLATASVILNGQKYWVVSREPGDGLSEGCDVGRARTVFVNHESHIIREDERFEGLLLSQGTTL